MKRRFFMLMCCAALTAMLLSGCNANNGNAKPSASPGRTMGATMAPGNSAAPSATGGADYGTSPMLSSNPTTQVDPAISADPGAMTTENMNDTTAAAAISKEVDKLSEVSASQAVVVGDTVLVAVTFDQQYQGGMTERVREMVEDKVKAAHQSAKNIYITDEDSQRTRIGELVTRTGEDIKNDVMDLVDDIKTAL